MLALANYSMKGPMQANVSIVGLSILSVLFSPLGILAGALIALVTLRISVQEGAKSLLWAIIAQVAVTILLSGTYFPAVIAVIEFLFPVFIMAVVLRRTNSLAQALQVGVLMIGAALILFHLAVGDTAAWWMQMFNEQLKPVFEKSGFVPEADVLQELTQMVTMLLGLFVLTLWFSILLLGRWYQSQLYVPGQFQTDFHQLALPRNTAYAAVAIAITGLLFGQEVGLLYDLSGVVLTALMFQGISITHFMVKQREANSAWLAGMYILLFILPQMMLILATIGLLDNWMNFRGQGKSQ